MVPSPTRRRLLGGIAVGSAGVLGALALPPSALPDGLVEARLGLLSAPTLDWHPAVTESHVEEGRSHLRDAVSRAESAWESIDRSTLSDDHAHYDSSLRSARSRLERVEGAPASRDALFDLLFGLDHAGRAIGGARVVRGEADPEGLLARGERIRRAAAETRDGMRYEVADPARGLAHLYAAERQLFLAGLNAYTDGTYAGGTRSPETISGYTVVSTWGSHLQARQHRRSGSQYYEQYRDGLDARSQSTRVAGRIEETLATAAATVTSNRQSHEERQGILDSHRDGPYRSVRFHLWQATHGDLDPFPDEGPWRGLTLYRAVRAARGATKLRAYEHALDALELAEGEDLDPALVHDAKRRAVESMKQVRSDRGDSPFLAVLLRDAGQLLESADLGSKRRDGDSPRWQERAETYAYYLVAAGLFREVGTTMQRFVESGG